MNERTGKVRVATSGVACVMVVFAALGVLADQSQAPASPGKQRPFDVEVAALAEATRKGVSHQFPVPSPPPPTRGRATVGVSPDPGADEDDYAADIMLGITKLTEYWSQAVPKHFGQPYRPLGVIHQYEPETLNKGYPCFGKFLIANNAFYCSDIHGIQWHGAWLFDLYKKRGDFAAIVILAHEWGHAVQSHVSRNVTFSIQRELQADCLAGVWSRWAQPLILESGDLEEAVAALYSLGDPQTPWFTTEGHGTGDQRRRSYASGFTSGVPTACSVN